MNQASFSPDQGLLVKNEALVATTKPWEMTNEALLDATKASSLAKELSFVSGKTSLVTGRALVAGQSIDPVSKEVIARQYEALIGTL